MLKLMYDALMSNGRVYVVEEKMIKFLRYCKFRKKDVTYSLVNVSGIDLIKFELRGEL